MFKCLSTTNQILSSERTDKVADYSNKFANKGLHLIIIFVAGLVSNCLQ